MVIDPIQSVKGKVVIDAFRLINPQLMMMGQEPRQSTSVVGYLRKPSIQALIHGLNRHYYSLAIDYRKNELEEKMLMKLHTTSWAHGLNIKDVAAHSRSNEALITRMLGLTKGYNKQVRDEQEKTRVELAVANVGKIDPRKHLKDGVAELMAGNIDQSLGTMVDLAVFH